jgi:adenylate cyclase
MSQPIREAELREILTGEHTRFQRFRNTVKHVPSPPRCKLCAVPFAGIGGAVLGHLGFGRFPGNPALCQNCVNGFRTGGLTGAEIPVSLLFADVRGSTGIAERMRPVEFRTFLDGFYRIGADAILGNDGLVDKLVGDEVIGLFFGGISGPRHAAAAVNAAVELGRRARRANPSAIGPITLGMGVHTGEAYVGTTGPAGAVDDFTALGDVVNTTARLASTAAAGEILVSLAAAEAAGHRLDSLERRSVALRGKQDPIDVVVIRQS